VGRSEASPPAYCPSATTSSYQEFSDSVSSRFQTLSTEHWSFAYNPISDPQRIAQRVEMFLALLTGAVIGLALLAQVDQSRDTFMVAAILILSVVHR
jgi:hypothetical protein